MKTNGVWKPFILNVSVVILLFIMGIFIGVFVRNKHLIEGEILTRARAHFHNIVLTRRWNANHGGVFVEKREGVESNPYLENPDIETPDGKAYTKKNPALMTREISQLAEKDGYYSFHITSLNPLNPGNAPDEFEKEALRRFEKGETELARKEEEDGVLYFRYMAPLVTEKSCLECHAKQGYKVGDIRGGISVTFNISDVAKNIRINTYIIFVLAGLTLVILLGIIYMFISRLMVRLKAAQRRIEEMAIMDDLTKIHNRRYFFERLNEEFSRAKRYGTTLSCIMLDADFFKRINDTHGHLVGDAVLAKIASIVKDNCRITDTVARYGGEEFAMLLPESERIGALITAEKMRRLVETAEITSQDGARIKVTISLGVASFTAAFLREEEDVHHLVKLADDALYRAKANGRNRVEFFKS